MRKMHTSLNGPGRMSKIAKCPVFAQQRSILPVGVAKQLTDGTSCPTPLRGHLGLDDALGMIGVECGTVPGGSGPRLTDAFLAVTSVWRSPSDLPTRVPLLPTARLLVGTAAVRVWCRVRCLVNAGHGCGHSGASRVSAGRFRLASWWLTVRSEKTAARAAGSPALRDDSGSG